MAKTTDQIVDVSFIEKRQMKELTNPFSSVLFLISMQVKLTGRVSEKKVYEASLSHKKFEKLKHMCL